MRVIVCGSRSWANYPVVLQTLRSLPPGSVIVHGAGRGADSLAARAAEALGFQCEPHPADWARFGKSAGPRRNAEMVRMGANTCIAFRSDGPSPGTDGMIRLCRKAGIPVRIYREPMVHPSPCSPGTHRGVRQSDGTLRCRVCGATGPAGWRQAVLVTATA
jgi:hypothetical protein